MIIKTTKKLHLPASEVWKVIGEGFGNVMWIKGVKSCKFEGELIVGNVRTVDMKGMGIVNERLEIFEPNSFTISYSVESRLRIIKQASNHWTIDKIDDQNCTLTCVSNLKLSTPGILLAPVMRFMMANTVKGLIDLLEIEVKRIINEAK